jgi:hypothetical protein
MDQKRVLWIAGAGCGAILLTLCCLMATGVYYCQAAWTDTEEAATEFLRDVREGRIEQAYARMSEAYRRENDLAAFRRDLEQTPGLLEHQAAVVLQRHMGTDQSRLGGVLTTPREQLRFEVVLEPDQGRWWVAGVNVTNDLQAPIDATP